MTGERSSCTQLHLGSTLHWDRISSGELRRNSSASAQQEMTMDHNTMSLPGCPAYTHRAAAASSTVPGWD